MNALESCQEKEEEEKEKVRERRTRRIIIINRSTQTRFYKRKDHIFPYQLSPTPEKIYESDLN